MRVLPSSRLVATRPPCIPATGVSGNPPLATASPAAYTAGLLTLCRLQVVVDGHAAVLLARDVRCGQVEVIDLGHAPGRVNHQVGSDLPRLVARAHVDDQRVAAPLDGLDRRAYLDVDAQVVRRLDELADEVGVAARDAT